MNLKRSKSAVDAVSSEDRLNAYTVTKVPLGVGQTGLPPAIPRATDVPHSVPAEELPERPMPADLHPVAERRDEVRSPASINVSVSHPHSSTVIEGVTVDVSPSGMCLHMAVPPPSAHQDVVVDNGETRSILWAQVLGYRNAPIEGYLWHIRVTAADESWATLVEAAAEAQAEVEAAEALREANREPRRRRPVSAARRSKRTA